MQAAFDKDGGRKELGRLGEEEAVQFLKKNGFRVLERNYRCRLGEIDLIVEKKGRISFVEVKTRRSFQVVSPLELISAQKKRHISRVAQQYLAWKKLQDRPAEFSLLIVDFSRPEPQFELIETAFSLEWGY